MLGACVYTDGWQSLTVAHHLAPPARETHVLAWRRPSSELSAHGYMPGGDFLFWNWPARACPESLVLPPAVCPGEGASLRMSVRDCGQSPLDLGATPQSLLRLSGPLVQEEQRLWTFRFCIPLEFVKFSESLRSFWIFKIEMEFTSCQNPFKMYSSSALSTVLGNNTISVSFQNILIISKGNPKSASSPPPP